jgi:NAD(P)-dependent dehydrogenase (short-subunit alcohol dehydrogenase family)
MSANGIAVVTGAAGGMGIAATKQLAAQGWSLLLCDLDEGRLETLAAPLRRDGQSVAILADDIADPGFPARLVAALGGSEIGALIHTAGLSPTMADEQRILAVNYDATARLVDAVRDLMAAGSCAVLIASSAGHMVPSAALDAALGALGPKDGSTTLVPFSTNPGMAYSVSKRGVLKMVAREAAAFGKRGARIMSISPGLIDTPMNRQEHEASPMMADILAHTPLGREGSADEIAAVALFLCSPAASFVTGSDIRVDGGSLAAMGV